MELEVEGIERKHPRQPLPAAQVQSDRIRHVEMSVQLIAEGVERREYSRIEDDQKRDRQEVIAPREL